MAESGARERLAPAALRYLFGGDIHGVSAEHAGAVVLLIEDDCDSAGGSLIRAKGELHVHVNTVVQRLDRIQVLLGRDWNEPDRALELQLALQLNLLPGARPAGTR